jgi:hypothetical protein
MLILFYAVVGEFDDHLKAFKKYVFGECLKDLGKVHQYEKSKQLLLINQSYEGGN